MRFATYSESAGPARAGLVSDAGIHPLPWRPGSARSASGLCR